MSSGCSVMMGGDPKYISYGNNDKYYNCRYFPSLSARHYVLVETEILTKF